MKSVSEEIPRPAFKGRQREIEDRLVACGFTRGPRRLRYDIGTTGPEASRARRVRTVLENLGPVFSAFGLYLSTRADLLPMQDCIELATIRDWSEPLPSSAVHSFITHELGRAPQEIFLMFEEKSFESRLLFQSHRGWFEDGKSIVVRIIRPEIEEQFRCDAALLPLLRVVFAGEIMSDEAFDSIVEDYCLTLRRQIDCLEQASAFQLLAKDAKEFGMLSVPVVHQQLCTSRLLTVEYLSGSSMNEIIPYPGWESEKAAREDSEWTRIDQEDLARRLCAVWLRQVFLGRAFPVEPSAANLTILPNGQVAFTGGCFESLQPEAKANLFDYLVATATDDPDGAYSCLFRELMKGEQAEEQDDLRKRFRQIVPLRDGAWTTRGAVDDLAEYVFAHWRLLGKWGHLTSHVSSFYRGLFVIVGLARQLVLQRDTLLEGLQDVRVLSGIEKLRDVVDPRHLGDQMEKYGAILIDLPRRLDEVLTLAAEGRTRLQLKAAESARHRRQKNSSAVVVALLVVLGAFALISHRLEASLPGVWVNGLGALVFIALGSLLLRAASRA